MTAAETKEGMYKFAGQAIKGAWLVRHRFDRYAFIS